MQISLVFWGWGYTTRHNYNFTASELLNNLCESLDYRQCLLGAEFFVKGHTFVLAYKGGGLQLPQPS